MHNNQKLTYQDAKKWAKAQNPLIDGSKRWRQMSKDGLLPSNIPAWPQGYYKDEFESWGEFLGSDTIAATKRQFKPYKEAKRWVISLTPKVTSKAQWCALSKSGGIPQDIPKDPRNHYGEDFKGWGDFLGTGTIAPQCRKMMSYPDLKQWVKEQSPIIYSRSEYLKRVKQSERQDIPTNPPRTYPKDFEGWATFLGTRTLSSTSMIERILKQELATFLPVNTSSITRLRGANGKLLQVDISIPSWNLVLEYDGKYYHQDKEESDQAKTFNLCQAHPLLRVIRIREHPLKKLDKDDLVIKPGMDPFSLTKKVLTHLIKLNLLPKTHTSQSRSYLKRTTLACNLIIGAKWRDYSEARKWSQAQDITSVAQWKRKTKVEGFLPADIPVSPTLVYGRNFLGWGDFLGVEIVASQHLKFQTYEQAQKWAKDNQVTTGKQWGKMSAENLLPKNFPSNPQATYKQQWRGWGAFLGNGKPKDIEWADFKEVKKWCNAQQPAIHTDKQWRDAKERSDFPKHFPKSIYYYFGRGVFERIRG